MQWSSSEAKALSQDKEFIPEVILQGNKCRNPDNDPEGPWCYVEISGNVTVDYCNLDLCGRYYKDKSITSTRTTIEYYPKNSVYLLPVLPVSPPVCLPDDPLLNDDLTTETAAMERSVLTPAKKTFFNPRTFGEGEAGESPSSWVTDWKKQAN